MPSGGIKCKFCLTAIILLIASLLCLVLVEPVFIWIVSHAWRCDPQIRLAHQSMKRFYSITKSLGIDLNKYKTNWHEFQSFS